MDQNLTYAHSYTDRSGSHGQLFFFVIRIHQHDRCKDLKIQPNVAEILCGLLLLSSCILISVELTIAGRNHLIMQRCLTGINMNGENWLPWQQPVHTLVVPRIARGIALWWREDSTTKSLIQWKFLTSTQKSG